MSVLKTYKAQQLIEFLLIVPFIVIILGVVTEYAYALNIDMTITQGLKDVTSSIYSEIKPGLTADQIQALVKSDLITYLGNNNVPTNAENNISVQYFSFGGETDAPVAHVAVFVAKYTYIPAFSLPNTYFKILPDQFNFVTSTAVPGAFLDSNSYYSNGVNSTNLDAVWAGTSSFSNLDSFSASENGIMKKNTATYGRSNILFLIPTTAPSIIPSGKAYLLVLWNGSSPNDASGTYTLNTNDGKIYKCTTTVCTDSGNTLINYIENNNYYNVIFDHDNAVSDYSNEWATTKSTQSPITVDNNTDLSSSSIDGILKRTLALFDTSSYSIGNYDNAKVSTYNTAISAGNTYNTTSFGSIVFVYTSADDLSKIETGSPPSVTYDFSN